jgi:formyl-CoA transferase
VNIAAAGKVIWTRLCEALGAPALAMQAEYATGELRSKNRAALAKVLSELTRRHSSAQLIALLNDAGVPCGPIYKMDQVFADPQVEHLQMAVPVPKPKGGELKLVGPAMKLSRTPARMKRAIGPAGEQNAEILGELGYSAAEIDTLRAGKVI